VSQPSFSAAHSLPSASNLPGRNDRLVHEADLASRGGLPLRIYTIGYPHHRNGCALGRTPIELLRQSVRQRGGRHATTEALASQARSRHTCRSLVGARAGDARPRGGLGLCLKVNRLAGLAGEDLRRTYVSAKNTLAIVVAPPAKLHLQPIPPSAGLIWRRVAQPTASTATWRAASSVHLSRVAMPISRRS
jgi:hypothetical protein